MRKEDQAYDADQGYSEDQIKKRTSIAILDQEIARARNRISHYAGRIARGTADAEDKGAYMAYADMIDALKAIKARLEVSS